jgi:hypothetical protein
MKSSFLVVGLCLSHVSLVGVRTLAQLADDPAKVSAEPVRGFVTGSTYRNPSLGVEFTVPDELQFRQPAMTTYARTGGRQIYVEAWSKPHKFLKYVDAWIIFSAETLPSLPAKFQSNDGFMLLVAQRERKEGFKPLQRESKEKLGDVEFLRADYGRGSRREIVLASLRKDYAYVFIFSASDVAAADALIKSTTLKLPQ